MKIVSRLLLMAGASLSSFVIACAYGTPYGFTRTGKVVDRATKIGIAGIQVSCVHADRPDETTTTEADGSFEIVFDTACTTIEADDVDGIKNGPYHSASVAYDPEAGPIVIELERR